MIKWQANKTFIFGSIQEYIMPTRDQEIIMKVEVGSYIYESELLGRLIVNGRYINGNRFSAAWKENCTIIGTLTENEVGDTTGTGGEVNTLGDMPGSGEGLAGTKTGVELRIKNIVPGNNISLSSDDNSVTINSTASSTPGDSVVDETSFDQSSDVGVNTEYSRSDHTHGTPSTPITKVSEITSGQGDITGDLTLLAGTNITLVQSGNNITVNGSSTAGGHTVEQFTLDGTDITNKYVDVSGTINSLTSTIILISGAPNQFYGDDYVAIAPSRVSWNGTALDGILTSGDKLTVLYK